VAGDRCVVGGTRLRRPARRSISRAPLSCPDEHEKPSVLSLGRVETMTAGEELARMYARRFAQEHEYRSRVWTVLVPRVFQPYVRPDDSVLDLGCGYGQFINNVRCRSRFGMDLNPAAAAYMSPEVTFLQQDCAERWNLPNESLDVVFTSNFFEHLPSKPALSRTVEQAFRCLKPRGRLIAMGPNVKYVRGPYWDFWDHHIPLTELSLLELLEITGFRSARVVPRFLPYTMVNAPEYPLFLVSVYLRVPVLWRFWGKQFLVVVEKPA
jgi:SAM-dependent methyltransferase